MPYSGCSPHIALLSGNFSPKGVLPYTYRKLLERLLERLFKSIWLFFNRGLGVQVMLHRRCGSDGDNLAGLNDTLSATTTSWVSLEHRAGGVAALAHRKMTSLLGAPPMVMYGNLVPK